MDASYKINMALQIKSSENGIRFAVKVVPGSSRTAIKGLLDNALKINLATPPEKGKANKELIKLLSQILNTSTSAIHIASGTHNTQKEIFVADFTESQLLLALKNHLPKLQE